MARTSRIELLTQMYPEIELLQADGFDAAIIGVDLNSERVVYDVDTMITILVSEGMSPDDAVEHLHFNVLSAYVGEKTPIYINSI